ncbi:efflux RND transporter periplasmic adaptor subunit [Caenimonas sedimenti]|nr:efflux RND transporter periplasmic adaptor subunit [Caenimonas sedimenti]
MKKLSWKLWAGGAALLALAGGGGWWWMQARAPEASYRTGKLERGTLQATVSASGTVTPVTQVVVGTQVSGQIKELYVDFNSEVKAGQLIAMIDPETFEYRVRQAQADVEASQAAVLTAQANSAASRASVSRAKVDHTEAQRDYERKKSLVEKQFITQSEADKAQALVNTTRESMASADAQLGVTEAQVKSAQANVQQRLAALAQARVDLARTRILSPVNGIVIKRAIEKGQTVAASLSSPELFVIAQNLQDMQVEASVDESDVSRIRLGQRATFTVDAFPGQTFEGEIRQVRKAAQTVASVVTYVAVLGFSNTGGRLLPGMTANVRVVTDVRENVLKVPNAALRVRIAGVEPAGAPGKPASGAAGAVTTGQAGWSLFSLANAQPAGGRAGGGLAAMKERLVAELSLTAEQQAKFDAITEDLRPKFQALRDLPEGERREARDKVLAEMRGRIAAMLNAEQKGKYAQMQAQAAGQAQANAQAPAAAAATAPAASSAAPAAGPVVPKAAAKAPAPAAPAAAAPAPGGGGGPLAEFRNRLVTELQLDAAQKDKVDAIYADARPKFGQLRELPQEERGKARERLTADIRARIADLLTPEQKTKYQAIMAEVAGRGVTRGRIFLLGEDGKPRAFNVRLGITDGTMTELLVAPADAGELKEGAHVITAVSTPAAARPAGTSPRMAF